MICTNCNGKGFNSAMQRHVSYADFPGDKTSSITSLDEVRCRQCKGTGRVKAFDKWHGMNHVSVVMKKEVADKLKQVLEDLELDLDFEGDALLLDLKEAIE